MESRDAEFADQPGRLMGTVTPDGLRVDKLMQLQNTRAQFRDHTLTRARAVYRDIDAWFAREVDAVLDDPKHVMSMEPPRSILDIEPPF